MNDVKSFFGYERLKCTNKLCSVMYFGFIVCKKLSIFFWLEEESKVFVVCISGDSVCGMLIAYLVYSPPDLLKVG